MTLALHYAPLSIMQQKPSNLPILLGSSPGLFWIRRFLVEKMCNPLAPPAKTRPYLLDTESRLERSLGNSSGESKILTFFSALNWKSYGAGSKQDQFRENRILDYPSYSGTEKYILPWDCVVGLIPGWGRSPGGGNANSLQYSCKEDSMERGAWWATVHGLAKVGCNWACTH